MISSWVLHPGRGISPSALELDEVRGFDKRIIGTWDANMHGKYYDTTLPLAAMQAISGHDLRGGYFKYARNTFYGDATFAPLSNLVFPWVAEVMENLGIQTIIQYSVFWLC